MDCPACGAELLLLETPLKTSMTGMSATVTKKAMIVHKESRSPRCDVLRESRNTMPP